MGGRGRRVPVDSVLLELLALVPTAETGENVLFVQLCDEAEINQNCLLPRRPQNVPNRRCTFYFLLFLPFQITEKGRSRKFFGDHTRRNNVIHTDDPLACGKNNNFCNLLLPTCKCFTLIQEISAKRSSVFRVSVFSLFVFSHITHSRTTHAQHSRLLKTRRMADGVLVLYSFR